MKFSVESGEKEGVRQGERKGGKGAMEKAEDDEEL